MPAFPMQNSDSQPSCVGVPGPPPAARMTSLTNRWPLRGSRPEITPAADGMAAPPSAMPAAGSISASARCTALVTRSPRFVVATDVDTGCRGMAEIEPKRQAIDIVGQIDDDPAVLDIDGDVGV